MPADNGDIEFLALIAHLRPDLFERFIFGIRRKKQADGHVARPDSKTGDIARADMDDRPAQVFQKRRHRECWVDLKDHDIPAADIHDPGIDAVLRPDNNTGVLFAEMRKYNLIESRPVNLTDLR